MKLTKYPRTRHFSWSSSKGDDDKEHPTTQQFEGRQVVVTEKMDGENTTIYHGGRCHARSVDGRHHHSRDWVKPFASNIGHLIPEGHRICGENLYAKHSINYNNLDSYFYGFSIWDDSRNVALSWDETLEYFNLLGITPVKTLYQGIYDESIIKSLWNESMWDDCEGYVLRIVDEISYDSFSKYVGKFVRSHHVQSDIHWMNTQITPNKLKEL